MSEEKKNDHPDGERNDDSKGGLPASPASPAGERVTTEGGVQDEAKGGESPPKHRRNRKGKGETVKEGGEATLLESPPSAENKPSPPPGKGAGPVAWLALFMTLLVAGGAGWFWWQDQQRAQRLEARLDELDQRLQQFPQRDELDQLASRLEQRLEALSGLEGRIEQRLSEITARQEASETRLKAAMDRLYQRMGRSSVDWILAEAEYLLRLANARLQLAHDPDTALTALRAADGRLAAIDDPALQPVREAIAREVAALEALPRLDLAGLAARLEALSGQLQELPLARRYLPPAPPPPPAEGLENTPVGEGPWWEQAWARIEATLKSLVVVRYNEEPTAPLLAPDQVATLRQALMMELELARAALVRGDQALYRDALQRSAGLIRRYFDPDAAATQAVLSALDELTGQTITVEYPDLSQSLRLLRAVKAEVGGGQGEEGAR